MRPISHQAVFSTNAYIMLYELESAPYAQKSSTITANKLKTLPNNTTTSTQINPIKSSNGITSDKVYGPELPPASMNGNGIITNGKNDSSSSSSESETETTVKRLLPAPSMPSISKIPSPVHEKSPPVLKPQNRPSSSTFKAATTTTTPVTKLVPYEMDDSSNCSDESNSSETRIKPKATISEWKVTTFTPTTTTSTSTSTQQEPSSEGRSWERKKSENTVGELMRMSHSGYGAPVSTWNGTRAQLDKEVNNERREERKRTLTDSSSEQQQQQSRAKHPKLNNYKSNPGYNPIQVIVVVYCLSFYLYGKL